MRTLVIVFLLCVAGCFHPAPYAPADPPPYAGARSRECSSDFSCGAAQRCVKQQFQAAGVCATVTDQNGLPQAAYMKRSDSVMPGDPHQCQFDTDCPPLWRCVKGNGIYGSCLK